jgi:hypothetical protein
VAQVLAAWAPYLVLPLAWLTWRFYFLELPYEPFPLRLLIDIRQDPLTGFATHASSILTDVYYIVLGVWVESAKLLFDPLPAELAGSRVLLALVAFVSVLVYLQGKLGDRRVSGAWVWLGLLAIFAGLAPVWLIGDTVRNGGYDSRYLLGALFGAAVLFAGLISLVMPKKVTANIFAATLFGLAFTRQIHVTNEFLQAWETQNEFYWQLHWRAPGVMPNTAFLFFYPIAPYMHQSSTSMAINSLYPQSGDRQQIDYWTYDLRASRVLKDLEQRVPLQAEYRGLTFESEDSSSLIFLYKMEDSCVWLLDSSHIWNELIPSESRDILELATATRIVNNSGDIPTSNIFGAEPQRNWCFFYEKADLAVQLKDWASALNLMLEAKQNELKSVYMVEYFPELKAYGGLNMWDEAESLSLNLSKDFVGSPRMMCSIWLGLLDQSRDSREALRAFSSVSTVYHCD